MGIDTEIAVKMSVADWDLVDATLDNIAAIALADDPPLAGKILTIRRLAWRQRPPVPERDERISEQCRRSVRLFCSQWDLVLDMLDRSARTSAQISRDEQFSAETRALHYEIGADQVRTAALIRHGLR